MKTDKVEYWVKNRTGNDLNLRDLGIRIPAQKTVNLGALNSKLTDEDLQQSELNGTLKHCFESLKLAKVPLAPKKVSDSLVELQISMIPIPSRTTSTVVVDSKENDFIEELSHFDEEVPGERYTDGFIDPMVETVRVDGEAGEVLDGDKRKFGAVVVQTSNSAKK